MNEIEQLKQEVQKARREIERIRAAWNATAEQDYLEIGRLRAEIDKLIKSPIGEK